MRGAWPLQVLRGPGLVSACGALVLDRLRNSEELRQTCSGSCTRLFVPALGWMKDAANASKVLKGAQGGATSVVWRGAAVDLRRTYGGAVPDLQRNCSLPLLLSAFTPCQILKFGTTKHGPILSRSG
ncbi:uncharacterized protein [Miscanthus floridulus]|uniref:uncharacterized protein isoform X2 n=1 Tax=Miscanthus floridulus TaxID=154761 RepID=UPI00345A92D0